MAESQSQTHQTNVKQCHITDFLEACHCVENVETIEAILKYFETKRY